MSASDASPAVVATRRSIGGPAVVILAVGVLSVVAKNFGVSFPGIGFLWGGVVGLVIGAWLSKYRIEVQRDGFFSIQGGRPRWYKAGERMLVTSRRPVTVQEYTDEESALAAWSSDRG
jgi:hypothetical protein